MGSLETVSPFLRLPHQCAVAINKRFTRVTGPHRDFFNMGFSFPFSPSIERGLLGLGEPESGHKWQALNPHMPGTTISAGSELFGVAEGPLLRLSVAN